MKSILTLTLTLAIAASTACAENWPNWRGPKYDGSTTEKNLPAEFSPTKGVVWSRDLEGDAASTPVVWGDCVFLTMAVEPEQKLYGVCFDRKTGDIKWKHAIGSGYRWDNNSNLSSPSPVTDGKLVYFFFATGDLAAYDFAGKEAWKKNLQDIYGKFATQWTYASSPMLYDGRLYFQVLQRDQAFNFGGVRKGEEDKPNDSYILALNPANGEQLWKVNRPSIARAESLEAFSTPVPYKDDKFNQLLITGGDAITGHDPKTGTEIWRWETWNKGDNPAYRLVPSPVAGEGIALACGPKREPVFAFKLSGKGLVKDDHIVWDTSDPERKNVTTDVSTPLFYEGRFYILNSDRMMLSCVEPKTGKIFWNERLEKADFRPAKFESSPTGADGKIYMIDHRGNVVVVKAGDKYELLAVNAMGGEKERMIRSGVVAAQGQLFVRTTRKLYCVAK